MDESVWSSRSGGRSEVFALLFSPSPKQDDGQKKALRKTLQHPRWAQKLRILYPNLLGALPSCAVGGAASSGGLPNCAAGLSAQGPAPPWGFCSSTSCPHPCPAVVNPLPPESSHTALAQQSGCSRAATGTASLGTLSQGTVHTPQLRGPYWLPSRSWGAEDSNAGVSTARPHEPYWQLACTGKLSMGVGVAGPWLCKMLNIKGGWIKSIQQLYYF